MPLPDIKLDDRGFEQIVADAKRRIPGYTPEWTDLNESDPGVTLLQLFASLAEIILWRQNQVPAKNYVKFLELLGIELQRPAPASAELTFTLTTPDGCVLIPQGTKVALADQADGPVIFETNDNLYAVGAKLVALQSFDSTQFLVLTESNHVDGKYFFPLSSEPQKGAAFYLGFDVAFPAGKQRLALTIHAYTGELIEEGIGIKVDAGLDEVGDEDALIDQPGVSEPPAQDTPPVLAFWEYRSGGTQNWRRLNVIRDTTASLMRSGTVEFEAPESMEATKLGLLRKPGDKPLFWLRFRIEEKLGAGYEIPPRLEDVLLNTITATNAVTVSDELLGASDGTPNQVFRLSNVPVLPEKFVLQVHEGEGFESWTRVRDFAGSKRDDRHYTLSFGSGEVMFGDGEQGKIPGRLVENPQRPDDETPNIKMATYRWGGGAHGNAGAKKITSLESPLPFVDTVTNLRPAIGGEDEETIEAAKLRAPESIRSRSRAVTAGDFEFLAKQTPGARIRRARALPLHHPPSEPGRPPGSPLAVTTVPVPGVVTVIIVPEALPELRKPVPSAETIALVGRWLNRHRLITTELYVAAPLYRLVEIEARVKVSPAASSARVEQVLQETLLAYFHPLTGGPGGEGWDFGRTIYFSETYRLLLNTPGVESVESGAVKTYVDGKPVDHCADFPIGDDELVFSEKHTLFVSYA